MNQHLKTAVVLSRQRTRSLYTAAPSGITHYPPVIFDYSPRPSPRKVPVQNSHEQPSASPATTLPTSYGPLPFPGAPWLTHSAPTYGVPPPLWLCPPLDAAWFPLALGIDVGPGPWDLVRKRPQAEEELEPVPEPEPVPWSFECGAFGIPKKGKRRAPSDEGLSLAVQVGEDSYFVRPDALGVADGVGGWAHHANIQADSARFARMLMHNCASEIANPTRPSDAYPSPPLTPCPSDTDVSQLAEALSSVSLSPDVCPKEILHMAYERTVATFRATGTAGSSTALVAVLRDGELSVAHLGDCMLAVVRDGKFVVRSEDMQHSFNFPYQLGPHSSTNPRADAQLIREKVVPGDIVILASDGLGDNLWDEEVLAEVERFVQGEGGEKCLAGDKGQGAGEGVGAAGEGEAREGAGEKRLGNPQILGEALARRAKKAAEGTRDVPFGVRGRAAGIQFMGGKTDDISVVVAVVRGPSSTPAPSPSTAPS